MADGEVAQKPSAGNYSVSPFVKKEVHDQIANRSAKKRVSWNWYDTWHEEHHRAFVVAKLCKADLLQEVHDSLQKAIDEGQTFEEWRKEIQPKLEGRWLGKTVGELWDELPEAEKKRLKEQAQKENRKDPEPNEKQRQEVISPKRLETIYRTNMKVAHVAGQYQSLVDEAELYPYWQYHTQEDNRVRDSHAVLNGKVFRHDDPFWDTHFPPNGWKCRCYVRSLDDDDLEEKGLKVLDSRDLKTREDKSAGGHTKLTYIIDGKEATTADGWNYNPGKVSQHIDAVADDKAEGYDPELGQQIKDDLNEEPKPAAPKKPSAAPGQPAKPSEPAKKTEPEKKAAPKSAADKAEEPKASGKPETKPAALPAKSEAAAPKSAQPTVKDSNVPVKSTTAAPKPAQPAVKPAAAPKPKQADGAHGEPKPAAAPKPIKPAPAPANKPDAPRIIEPIKPADPSVPRVVKPIEPIEPSVPRVVEPIKPEAKQGILQTIRGKVSRAVDRVLSWLGVSSKWSAFEKLADEGGQDTYYGSVQSKESQSTAAKYATTAQPQQRDQQTAVVKDNIVPSSTPAWKSIQSNGLKLGYTGDNKLDYTSNLSEEQKQALKKTVQEKTKSKIPLSPEEYKNWLSETLPLAHKRAELQDVLSKTKDKTAYAAIKKQMADTGEKIGEYGSKVVVSEIPEYIIKARDKIITLVAQKTKSTKKKRHITNIKNALLWMDADSGARHATRSGKVYPNIDAVFNIHSYLNRAENAGEYGGIFYELDENSTSARHDGDIICIIPDQNFNENDKNSYQLTKIVITTKKGEAEVKTIRKINLSDYNSCIPNPKKQTAGIWHKIKK